MIRTNTRTIALFATSATRFMSEATDGTTGSVGGAATEVKPTLTPAQKRAARVDVLVARIAADTTTLAALRLEIETSERLASVAEGTAVVVRIGRAETSREVAARVLGVKTDDNGSTRYKVTYGSGFDADTIVIQPSQIISVIAETAPAATSEAAGEDEFGRPVDINGNLIG